jgi:hypothetical protein
MLDRRVVLERSREGLEVVVTHATPMVLKVPLKIFERMIQQVLVKNCIVKPSAKKRLQDSIDLRQQPVLKQRPVAKL